MTHQAFAEVSTHAHQIRAGSVQETKLRDNNDSYFGFLDSSRLFAERGWLLCPADQSLNNSFLLRLV